MLHTSIFQVVHCLYMPLCAACLDCTKLQGLFATFYIINLRSNLSFLQQPALLELLLVDSLILGIRWSTLLTILMKLCRGYRIKSNQSPLVQMISQLGTRKFTHLLRYAISPTKSLSDGLRYKTCSILLLCFLIAY